MDILKTIFLAVTDDYTESEELCKEGKDIDELMRKVINDNKKFVDLSDKVTGYEFHAGQEYFTLGFKTAFSLLREVNK